MAKMSRGQFWKEWFAVPKPKEIWVNEYPCGFEVHDTRVPIPYKQLQTEGCPKGGQHKIWHSYVGDNWPAFCAECGAVSNETPPYTGNWEDF